MPLTPKFTSKQSRWIDEFMVDGNATQAAIRSGFSAKTARQQGARLLSNVAIAEELARRRANLAMKIGLKAETVLEELRRVAFVDRRSLFTWGPGGVRLKASDELTPEEASIVEEVSQTITESGGTIRVKTGGKVEALKILAQCTGLFEKPETGEQVHARIVLKVIEVKVVPT
jgi:phage terminase small subunit